MKIYEYDVGHMTFLKVKVKAVDFSEPIAASDPKVGRYRQLIELIM